MSDADTNIPTKIEVPESFKTTLSDFVRDLATTFPEFADKWADLTKKIEDPEELMAIFRHCLVIFPVRFFDILYQNEEMFQVMAAELGKTPKDVMSEPMMFLPGIDFRDLYNCEGVTETTKNSIWKYLQLLMFSLVESIKDKSHFGESASMFEGIDEEELQTKMTETLENISEFFTKMSADFGKCAENMGDAEDESTEKGDGDTDIPEFNFDKTTGMPDLNNIHEHLKGLFDGKIGNLAKNIAEEISGEFEEVLGDDYKDVRSTKDVFQKIMKNPKKMMDLVKKVGDKIKARMDAGEISKDDIMHEAGDILRKMKEMSGGNDENLQEMLRNMAKGMGMGKNARVDMNAVNRMTKQQAMRERIKKKLDARKQQAANFVLEQTGQSNFVFKMPEEGAQERSAAPKYTDEQLIAELSTPEPVAAGASQKNKKKNKGKGKK